jgi:hypothetical protein
VRLLLPGPLLLLCAACATLRTHDITDAFAADAAHLVERPPTKADEDPARAGNAPGVMLETERLARDFLRREPQKPASGWTPSTTESYARALLACALLAQGYPAKARDAFRWTDRDGAPRHVKPRLESDLTHENVVIACAIHAASVCRSIEARTALERFFAGSLPAVDFVKGYGSFAGLVVGEPGSPDAEKMTRLAAANLESTCAPGVAEPDAGARKARAELLRVVSEQVYNDAASLLARLPPPPEGARPADEVWLAKVAVKSVAVYRYLIPDMLPEPLSPDQRAWQREQAFPLFKNARTASGWFLGEEARKRVEETRIGKTPEEVLYDRLLSAQLEVLAWIDSR